jgi:hypothetical protein
MPVIQTRNAEAQMLGSADHLATLDRNFAFSAYNTSAESFVSTTVLGLNTVTLNFTPDIFDLTSNILTLGLAGMYLLRMRSAVTMSGGGAGAAAFMLHEDPDTGSWGVVPASTVHVYLPASTDVSWEASFVLRAQANYRYRIAGVRTAGAGNVGTLNNSTSLFAVLLQCSE